MSNIKKLCITLIFMFLQYYRYTYHHKTTYNWNYICGQINRKKRIRAEKEKRNRGLFKPHKWHYDIKEYKKIWGTFMVLENTGSCCMLCYYYRQRLKQFHVDIKYLFSTILTYTPRKPSTKLAEIPII